jgi:hypothetical protein
MLYMTFTFGAFLWLAFSGLHPLIIWATIVVIAVLPTMPLCYILNQRDKEQAKSMLTPYKQNEKALSDYIMVVEKHRHRT